MLMPASRAAAANRARSWAEPPATRTLAGHHRPLAGPGQHGDGRCGDFLGQAAAAAGRRSGPAPARPRQIIMVTTRCAASASRSGGSAPLRTAAMIAACGGLHVGGHQQQVGAGGQGQRRGGVVGVPSLDRAHVERVRDGHALESHPPQFGVGRLGRGRRGRRVRARARQMWPVMTIGSPASMAAWKGIRSLARSCSRLASWTGSRAWESTLTEPWPGKCDLRPAAAPRPASPGRRRRRSRTRRRVAGHGPGADGRIGRAHGDVGGRGEVGVEAQRREFGGHGLAGLAGQRPASRRAVAHRGGPFGQRAPAAAPPRRLPGRRRSGRASRGRRPVPRPGAGWRRRASPRCPPFRPLFRGTLSPMTMEPARCRRSMSAAWASWSRPR